jgi:hypothetical protein
MRERERNEWDECRHCRMWALSFVADRVKFVWPEDRPTVTLHEIQFKLSGGYVLRAGQTGLRAAQWPVIVTGRTLGAARHAAEGFCPGGRSSEVYTHARAGGCSIAEVRASKNRVGWLVGRARTIPSAGTSARAVGVFLAFHDGLILLREVGEFAPALGHCQENRGALKRDVSSFCARRAI